jgi:hypothetical protein
MESQRRRSVDQAALRDLVENGSVPFRQNARSYRLYCPRCNKQKLYVQKSDGRCRCMKCGEDFRGWADFILSQVYDLRKDDLTLRLYEGMTPGTAAEFERADFVDHWEEWADPDEVLLDGDDPPPPPIIWDPDIVDVDHRLAARGLAYLEKRGISLDLGKKYGVRYNIREKRVCFPVVVDGVLRGWQGRYIDRTDSFNEEGHLVSIPKILTVGRVGGRVLMFQDRLKGSEHGIMVEGPFDAVKCDLCGGNTDTMGKSFTPEQARIYLRSGIKRLYVGLDDDAFGRIHQVARDLAPHLQLYRLATPPGREDLGDSTPEEVYEQFRSARPLNPAHVYHHFVDHWAN